MALGSHLITVRRFEKYIDDVIGKKANLPDTSKTIIGNISQINRVSDETYTNLINPTAQTETRNGITFTNNGDGTYTVNGTASAYTFFNLNYVDMSTLSVPIGTYKLTGTPPNNGGVYTRVIAQNSVTIGFDTGSGSIFTVPQDTTTSWARISIDKGTTCNNLLFKPMITTKLDATYDDFIPYSGSGALNENVAEMYEDISQINSDLSDIVRTANIFKEGVTLTANAETSVDFTSEITNATPSGYKFIGMTFCGAYPNTTWNNTSVTPVALHPTDKSMKFTTTWTQPYNLCMMAIFIRNI